MRDLFQQDDCGWLENIGLLDRLVTEKLQAEVVTIAAEGWRWIDVSVDLPFGLYAQAAQTRGRADGHHGRRTGDDRGVEGRV